MNSTVERNCVHRWRFLMREFELVKSGGHLQCRFREDFHRFCGTSLQTFYKYHHRFLNEKSDQALMPQKRGPRWKSRRTPGFIEQLVLEQRRKSINRYEIYAILKWSSRTTPALHQNPLSSGHF